MNSMIRTATLPRVCNNNLIKNTPLYLQPGISTEVSFFVKFSGFKDTRFEATDEAAFHI